MRLREQVSLDLQHQLFQLGVVGSGHFQSLTGSCGDRCPEPHKSRSPQVEKLALRRLMPLSIFAVGIAP